MTHPADRPLPTIATETGLPTSTLHDDVTGVLRNWAAPGHAQSSLREAYLGFLAARPDATWRSCKPGHVTASAIVLSADLQSVLLTLHPRVGSWVQLGGHCEPGDPTIAAAALREATEESGIEGLLIDPDPVHLEVHPITCSLGIPTRHFDVRFRVIAPAGGTPKISSESLDLRFFPVNALPTDSDEGVGTAIRLALTHPAGGNTPMWLNSL